MCTELTHAYNNSMCEVLLIIIISRASKEKTLVRNWVIQLNKWMKVIEIYTQLLAKHNWHLANFIHWPVKCSVLWATQLG